MKKTALIVTALAMLFLVLPVFAIDVHTLTVHVTDNTADENRITADFIKVFKQDTGDFVDSCTDQQSCDFLLAQGTYRVYVEAPSFIPRNETNLWVGNNRSVAVRLTADNTSPSTSIILDPEVPNENGWYNDDVRVTFVATDTGSGVKVTKYCRDQTNNCDPTNEYTGTFTVVSDGTWYIRFFSEDWAQNKEDVQSQVIRIDQTKPVVNSITAKTDSQGSNINEDEWQDDNDPYFSWSVSPQDTSGIAGFSFALDESPDETVDTANGFYQYDDDSITDGKHTFYVKALDNADNWGQEKSFDIWVDASTPDIVEIKAYTDSNMGTEIADSTWQTDGDPYFVWTDPYSPSDDTFYYTLDGTEPDANSNTLNSAVYDRTANAFAEGTTTLKVKVQNGAGTWGTTRTFVLKYDGTAPTTTITLNPANPDGMNNWYVSDITVTLTCNDVTSGCAETKYRVNSGNWTTYTAPFTLSTDGNSIVVDYYSVDNAGNTESTQSSNTLKMDQTDPVWSNENHTDPAVYSSGGNYDFSMDWTDAMSGINTVTFTFDGTDYNPSVSGSTYSYTLSDLPAGDYTFKWTASDNAGNSVSTDDYTFTVQKATPEINMSFSPSNSETYGTQTTVTCTITTGDSGAILKIYRNGGWIATGPSSVFDTATLAAGTYDYYCEYIESTNYTALITGTETLTINKASTSMTLYLDGSAWTADDSRTYPTATDVNATINVSALQSSVVLKRNSVAVSNPDSGTLDGDTYVYVGEFAGNENYTASSATQTLTINPADNPVTLTLNGQSADLTEPYGTNINASGTSAGGTLVLTRNGTDITSELDTDVLLDAGVYEYTLTAVGNNNYKDNSTGVTYTVTITKVPASMTLLFDGVEGNTTAERGDVVNITAILNVTDTVHLFIDDIEVASGSETVQYDYDTSSVSLTTHKIEAITYETQNQFGDEATYYITVQDTQAPIITVISPVNGTTYQQNYVLVSITTDEDLSGATVSLDNGASQALAGSGTSWSMTLTSLSEGAHNVTITAQDKASNSNTTDAIYFTIPSLSHIVNSTVDGTYYVDVYMNIYSGTSTIANSEITDSTVTNSTIIDSTVEAKTINRMVIIGSDLDPADFEGSDIRYSNVTENDDNYIRYSNVTNSTILYSDIEYSDITLSHIEYSTLKDMMVGNANISYDYMYTGWMVYDGTNYTSPTNITELISGSDTTKPVIESMTPSNTTPAPGDTITMTVIAKDNVAVQTVTLNGTAMTFAGGYSYTWTGALTIPSADGEYSIPVVASDYAGNQRTQYIGITVNSSDTPQVKFDLDAPVVGIISPTSATEGTITFTANASDASGITSCWLFIDGANNSEMAYVNGTATVDVGLSAGTYGIYAACSDPWDNIGEGPLATVTINSAGGGGGGGGGGAGIGGGATIITPLTAEMEIDAPAAIDITAGETETLTMTIRNTGTGSLSNVRIGVTGLPATWLVFSSQVPSIPVDTSVTNTITVSIPADEPTGTRTITISVLTAEGESSSKSVALRVTGAPQPPETNVTPTTPTPPAPSGITGAIIALASNPTALGFVVAAIIVGGAIVWSRKMPKRKPTKAAKTERKYI